MFLKHKPTGDFVEVLDVSILFNPCESSLEGRLHVGEEMQEPMRFAKAELVFPSSEALPRCWVDPHYKD